MDNLYEESKVKNLRLYLCIKRVNVELSSEEEEAEMHLTSTPTVDLTGHEPVSGVTRDCFTEFWSLL